MICSHCGTPLPAGALFCGECGRPVAARSEAAAPARVAPIAEPIVPEELVAPAEPAVSTGGWSLDLPEPARSGAAEASEEALDRGQAPDVREETGAPVEPDARAGEASPPPLPDLPLPPRPEDPVTEEPRGAGWCAQCGALMSASDIFCGECGFVRQVDRRPRDTEVLDPFPWGIDANSTGSRPAAAVVPEPQAEAPSGPRDEGGVDSASPRDDAADDVVDDFDDTRIVAPGARGDRFVLQFSTGESVSVTGSGLLGRNPVAEPGEYFDALVTVSDPGRSVSKTHLEFGQEGGAFWVSDRYSGNGTVIREPERVARRCDPGKRYRIARGTRVDIGEQFFVVS